MAKYRENVRNAISGKPIPCGICRMEFQVGDPEALLAHLKEHFERLEGKYYCNVCKIAFVHEADLQRHEDSARNGDCGFKFQHKNPCTGHHPPFSESGVLDDANWNNDRDRFDFCYRIRYWEQCQLGSYISSINRLKEIEMSVLHMSLGIGTSRDLHDRKRCRDCSIVQFSGEELGKMYPSDWKSDVCPSSENARQASEKLIRSLCGAREGVPGHIVKRRKSFSEGCEAESVSCGTDHCMSLSKATFRTRSGALAPDPSYFDKTWLHILHRACGSGDLELARFAIANGAEIDGQDLQGWSALHLSAMIDTVDVTRLLLLHGASIGLRDHSGRTALVTAVARDAMNVAQLLIDHGAMKDANDQGDNVLRAAFFRAASATEPTTLDAELAHSAKIVQKLSFFLENGASVSAKFNGRTGLWYAITSGHMESVVTLLDHGAHPKERCSHTVDPLLTSINAKYLDIAHLIIERGASVTEKHLMKAIMQKADMSFLGMLVGKCVDSKSPAFGHAALVTAVDCRNVEALQMLIERNVDVNILNGPYTLYNGSVIARAARCGHTEIMDYLISHGARLDLPIGKRTVGLKALHTAANRGHPEILKMLLGHGVSINDPPELESEHTVLCEAARSGHLECVQILLENGVALEARCDNGETALMSAASACNVDVVQCLLSIGASVNVECKRGHRPICHSHCADRRRTEDTIQLLLSMGANPERCEICSCFIPSALAYLRGEAAD